MNSSQALLLPLHSLPCTHCQTLDATREPAHTRIPLLHRANSSPGRGRRCRSSIIVQASAGKGFGQLAEKKAPPSSGNGSDTRSEKKDDDDDEIPQVVFERMIRRILFYVGAPMAAGVGLLYLFDRLKTEQVWDVPVWVPFMTILIGFGSSALGIAYGTLSASWDPDKEGSLLGWEEALKNWPVLWEEDEKANGR